jgi:hypothetical protein
MHAFPPTREVEISGIAVRETAISTNKPNMVVCACDPNYTGRNWLRPKPDQKEGKKERKKVKMGLGHG